MKKFTLLILVMLVVAGMALAQTQPVWTPGAGTTPTAPSTTAPHTNWPSPPTLSNGANNVALSQDVLGAHNGYGRGCVMCHAPHGGALGNNAPAGAAGPFANTTITGAGAAANSDGGNGSNALWGENLAPYYGATVTFAGGTTVALPANAGDSTEGTTTILLCLSCHDGAVTKPAMMRGWTVEALPIVGGAAPTLFGTTAGNSALDYVNEHPVGVSFSCNSYTAISESGYNWDCTGGGAATKANGYAYPAGGSTPGEVNITASMNMYTFVTSNYPASFWYNYATSGKSYPLSTFYASATSGYTVNGVQCTTCHNQHSMTVYSNNSGSYPTMFFIKGEYMPSSGGNSVAQFCRNCHGGESNEMAGLTSVKTN